MNFSTRIYRSLFAKREREHMEFRMIAKRASAHAENLERTVTKFINGNGHKPPVLPSIQCIDDLE